MTTLTILHYPDPRLHNIAKPVKVFDSRLQKIVADMAQTMYEAPGIGLAATQVNIHEQIVVIDTSETKDQLLVLINPKITQKDGCKLGEEGCLSVPGIFDKVERAETVHVEAQNVSGQTFTLEASGLLAVCIQHELDHLQGKVFVQHLSRLKQSRIANKLKKNARHTM